MNLGTGKIEELGRRAVACARWRWMPGMLTVQWWDGEPHPYRCRRHWRGHVAIGQRTDGRPEDNAEFCLPDLTDPATLGALLALVHAAYDDERAHVRLCAGGWDFYTVNPMAPPVTAPTEAHCLVAALEAAP